MALSHPTTGLLQSMVDEKGRTLRVEYRQRDERYDATLMCQSSGKGWKNYIKSRDAKDFLAELEATVPIGAVDPVIQDAGGNGQRHTWVCGEIAVDLARWISPKFGVFMTRLVLRYAKGLVTTEESLTAAKEVAAAAFATAPKQHPAMAYAIEWKQERGDAREGTKGASAMIQSAGMERKPGYEVHAQYNDGANWAVTGRKTAALRKELGMKRGTPRDRMQPEQLAMVRFQAGMIKRKLEAACTGRGRGLQDREILAVSSEVQRKVYAVCRETGAHTLPLLAAKPPQPERIEQAIEAERPFKRQKTLLSYMPKTMAPPSQPAPVSVEGSSVDLIQ